MNLLEFFKQIRLPTILLTIAFIAASAYLFSHPDIGGSGDIFAIIFGSLGIIMGISSYNDNKDREQLNHVVDTYRDAIVSLGGALKNSSGSFKDFSDSSTSSQWDDNAEKYQERKPEQTESK
jgi:hypothetical protein